LLVSNERFEAPAEMEALTSKPMRLKQQVDEARQQFG